MLPKLKTLVPGPKSKDFVHKLKQYESPNVTYTSSTWPIFWKKAEGVNVWDEDGNRFLDMTAGFGVANVGHCNPAVVKAIKKQAGTLLHAMGDVHPSALKAELAKELSQLTFEHWTGLKGKTIFCNSGAEAVEAAIKTAWMARPGRHRVLACTNAYHGLTLGALHLTYNKHFKQHFKACLGDWVTHIDFGKKLPYASELDNYAAVVIEPIQGRGGNNVLPAGYLQNLKQLCIGSGALLIFDEIYTGFCRTGKWFACEHDDVYPDIICVGKGMAGGFPISACIGQEDVINAWPDSTGEAIHTSTFLGNPVGCAAALAAINEMRKKKLADRAAKLGSFFENMLVKAFYNDLSVKDIRGKGLMYGVEFNDPQVTSYLVAELLKAGVIILGDGPTGAVLQFTPPLTVTQTELMFVVGKIRSLLLKFFP